MEIYQFILGGAVAFVVGFVLLLSSRDKKDTRASIGSQTENGLKVSQNGKCHSEMAGSTDIIIVGAGVAGSALAYALGKVIFSLK